MKRRNVSLVLTLSLTVVRVLAGELKTNDILAAVNTVGTNIQFEVERIVRMSPNALSSSNSIVVFQHGPPLRPSLRILAQSEDKELSFAAKQWLACVGDYRDLDLRDNDTWLRVADRDISDSSLDKVIARTMDYIVEREKDQLRPPSETSRCTNTLGTAVFATCVTSSRINNHGRCQLMYYSKEKDVWKLQTTECRILTAGFGTN